MSRAEYIDKYMSKWVSRKLLVFLIATVALFTGHLESSHWVVVATAYISIEGVTKIVERLSNWAPVTKKEEEIPLGS